MGDNWTHLGENGAGSNPEGVEAGCIFLRSFKLNISVNSVPRAFMLPAGSSEEPCIWSPRSACIPQLLFSLSNLQTSTGLGVELQNLRVVVAAAMELDLGGDKKEPLRSRKAEENGYTVSDSGFPGCSWLLLRACTPAVQPRGR